LFTKLSSPKISRRVFNSSAFCGVILSLLPTFSVFAKEIKIGVSLPTQRDIGWVRYREYLEEYGRKSNVKILMQVADQSASAQASQVENLLSQKIDVLILAPQDAAAAGSLISAAHKANVKVISFDRLVSNAPVDVYLSFDNVKVGELQGQYLTKHIPKGNYIVLSGAPTDNNSKLFKQGAMKYIEPLVKKGDIKIVMEQSIEDWQPGNAQRLVENALTANKNNVQAVLAPNDNTAGGVIQALASQKLAGKVAVTGQDGEVTAAQRILAGTQAMTVFKNQQALSAEAIKVAMAIAENKPVHFTGKTYNGKIEVPSVLLEPVAVDKANLDKQLIDSGYLKREDVYKFVKKK
jgi:D-xylose transport system substrate-binding protein